jgi:hypothetical protein
MDKIVEGSRRGIPEFYIVIRKEGKEQKSFFLLDEEEQERDVFCVRSFGFDNQGFMEFYRKLRWIVPGRTRIIASTSAVHKYTRSQHLFWYMKKYALIPSATLHIAVIIKYCSLRSIR